MFLLGTAYGVTADDRARRLLRCAKREDARESRTTHPIGILETEMIYYLRAAQTPSWQFLLARKGWTLRA
jgi:hypothetical protein